MKIKKITQAQHSRLLGFYVSRNATSEEAKMYAIRRILGITDHPEYSLSVLEHLFVSRFVQHV
jgi:hypothetical protein